MALYHFHVTQIKRSRGHSAVASAAYRAGEKLHSERYGEYSDYTRKGGVIFSEILLSPQAPREYEDRETLWNAVEKAEKRPDAQLAYSFDFAFQNEFTLEENIDLARRFMEENFLSRGMTVDYAIHEPDREPGGIPNPHIHVMAPIRPINSDGTWGNKQKKIPVLDENGKRVWDEKYKRWRFTAVPTTDWGSPETLEEWRKNWCDLCNAKFEEKGLDVRIDWRSYERQGVDLLAQVHEGPAVRAMEKKGVRTNKGDYNRWVKATNAVLKSLREKIAGLLTWIKGAEEKLSEPEQPSLIEILMDYMEMQNTGAKNFSSYGRKKANLTTLKDVAEAVAYLQENDITTLGQLEEKLNGLREHVDGLGASMKEKAARRKILKEALGQVPVYKENLPIFREMGNRKYKFKSAKDKYKADHESELKLFYRARRILKEAGMPPEFSEETVEAWRKELAALQTDYDAEYTELKPLRDEQQKMSHIQYCVNRVIQQNDPSQQKQKTKSVDR
ncbi:MAG: MobA/MobL family protein [Clostridiales bacterium]|nr:MobA/MobL family protein [Clostridiales bacterium]